MLRTSKKSLASVWIMACLASCGGGEQSAPKAQGTAMPPPEVEVMTVGRGDATVTQDLPGRLQAYRTAQVRARVEGIVDRRNFHEGTEVKTGASLFQIDARTYRAIAESAKADYEAARQTVERYKSLLEIRAVSQQDFDLANAKATQAKAAMIRAEEDLQNASVPAPISGHIGRAMVTEGAFVGKGEATLLATIEQIDPIYANFTQSGVELLRLKQSIRSGKLKNAESTKVELVLEDGSVYPIAGKLFFTDMAVDPSTGAVSLRAEFPNPKRELLPGMFARVRFPQAVAEQVIRIPQRAVQAGPQGQFVLAVSPDGKSVPLPVKTGGMSGADFIIVEGLKGGEQIIVNGIQKARPGTPVKPVPLGGAASSVVAASAPAAKSEPGAAGSQTESRK